MILGLEYIINRSTYMQSDVGGVRVIRFWTVIINICSCFLKWQFSNMLTSSPRSEISIICSRKA